MAYICNHKNKQVTLIRTKKDFTELVFVIEIFCRECKYDGIRQITKTNKEILNWLTQEIKRC
ncbi:conjugal transfer protein [Mycoplasma mycoides]|uniref:conjugal transfer protein n=1 Tax=Mycoplasma mycoides TaxID=2102 RepID=UPI00223F871D|nr:conjugal transfer protein [Mycoplasma mycoides]QVK06985.1 conjugal transfer protein [Mycoplasma mycoides subsp. capri]